MIRYYLLVSISVSLLFLIILFMFSSASADKMSSSILHRTINERQDSYGIKVKYEDSFYYSVNVFCYSDGTKQLTLYIKENVIQKIIYLTCYDKAEFENITEE